MPTTRAGGEPAEDRLGVAAEAERGVDQHGAVALERGRQKSDDPVEEDRDVAGAAHGRGLPTQAREEQEGDGEADRGRGRERHHGGGLAGLVAHPAVEPVPTWRAMLMVSTPLEVRVVLRVLACWMVLWCW